MAESLLVVRLDVQEWNIVIAGLHELPLKHSLAIYQKMMGQLQGQAPVSNGVDANPPVGFSESSQEPA